MGEGGVIVFVDNQVCFAQQMSAVERQVNVSLSPWRLWHRLSKQSIESISLSVQLCSLSFSVKRKLSKQPKCLYIWEGFWLSASPFETSPGIKRRRPWPRAQVQSNICSSDKGFLSHVWGVKQLWLIHKDVGWWRLPWPGMTSRL